jgi:hypothetical protein
MAINVYTLNGQSIDPEIDGLSRDVTPLRDTLEMAPKNNRHYHRGERISWTLRRRACDAARWAVWKAAAPRGLSVTLIEPDGATWTVVITGFSDPIAKTRPATGEIWRDITITCETL